MSKATDTQVGGDHYKGMAIQPVQYIHANGIGFMEGCAIKYLSRWRAKNGIEDLRKAAHFVQLLIELEEAQASKARDTALATPEPVADEPWFPKHGETYWSHSVLCSGILRQCNMHESITRRQAERWGVYQTRKEAIAKCKPADTPSCTPARQDADAKPEPGAVELTAAEEDMVQNGKYITAINSVRVRSGLWLRDAKAVVDKWRAAHPPAPEPKRDHSPRWFVDHSGIVGDRQRDNNEAA